MAGSRPPGSGGTYTHKPGCKCIPCSSRARKAQAIAGGVGNELATLKETAAIINADLDEHPPIVTMQGTSARHRIGQWLSMRTAEPGITNIEVAKRLGIAPRSLNTLISKASKEGWLKFDDPLSRIEHEIIPKTIDNLNYWLDKKDKTISLETAKGTIFKVYQASKGALEAPQTVLALKIEMAGAESAKVIEGCVVGKPRQLEEVNES
jgi:hypothetical protein